MRAAAAGVWTARRNAFDRAAKYPIRVENETKHVPSGRSTEVTERDLPAPVARAIEFASDGFNGYSRFAFELEGEVLQSMTITA